MCALSSRTEIVENWLPRYTGVPLDKFGEYILLTNFQKYVDMFAKLYKVPVHGRDKPMPTATSGKMTIVNFGMGSANAATVMDLLSAIKPKAVLFLGKCGGIKKKVSVGDLILPIAAVRGEGTSNDYFPPEVPALPSFALQKAISTTIRDHAEDYWTGTVYTTNRRVWEHHDEFKKYLTRIRVWRSTWRPPPSSWSASPTRSRRARCSWSPTSRWCPRGSRRSRATGRSTTHSWTPT